MPEFCISNASFFFNSACCSNEPVFTLIRSNFFFTPKDTRRITLRVSSILNATSLISA